MAVLDRILRAGEGRKVKALAGLVPDINALEPEITKLSDDALRGRTADFRQQLDNGADLDDLLIEAFAVIARGRHRGCSASGTSTCSSWVARRSTSAGWRR